MITKYHPKILEFLYKLSLQDRYYSDRELARRITVNNERVTSKTIRRWFDFLHSQCFDYYPYPFLEKIGLGVYYSFNNKLLLTNYLSYANISRDLSSFRKVYISSHWFPQDKAYTCKKVLAFHSKEVIYGPLHLYIKDGLINPLDNLDSKYKDHIKLSINRLKHIGTVSKLDIVYKNPIIVPLIFEYEKDHFNSVDVWRNIYSKLGDSVWSYFRKLKKLSKDSAIKKIQILLKQLFEMGLFKKVMFIYPALEEKNIFIWLYVDITLNELEKKLYEIALLSPVIYIYKEMKKERFLLNLLINPYSLYEILDIFEGKIINLYLVDYKSSQNVWNRKFLKFSYVNCWKRGAWAEIKKKEIII